MVKSVETGKDGIICERNIKYQNFNKNTGKETFNKVRQLVVIHPNDKVTCSADLNYSWVIKVLEIINAWTI